MVSKQVRKIPLKLSWLASIVYGCSQGIIGWTIIQGLAIPGSFAQEVNSQGFAPLEETGEPPSTFLDEDIPPETTPAPLFDVRTSGQFNLYRLAIGDGITRISHKICDRQTQKPYRKWV